MFHVSCFMFDISTRRSGKDGENTAGDKAVVPTIHEKWFSHDGRKSFILMPFKPRPKPNALSCT